MNGSPSTPDVARRVAEAFDAACRDLGPMAEGAHLLLGCSAGGDSMALLHLAADVAAQRRWRLQVIHLDHRQRPQSADEAQWVAQEGARCGVEARIERLSDALAEVSPLSEDVMRQARHECFAAAVRHTHADAVVLAHQADDQAETFLIRLLAGSGPTGLSGMKPVDRVGDLTLVRPLLGVRRADLRTYLESRGATWHDDPSNADPTTRRAWVRHVLMPGIREHIGLDPTERITRAAGLIAHEAEAWGRAADLLLDLVCSTPPSGALGRLDQDHPAWRGADDALRREMLRHWLWRLRAAAHPPGYAAVEEALKFSGRARRGSELRTVDRMHIVRGRRCLVAFAPETSPSVRRSAMEPLLATKPTR